MVIDEFVTLLGFEVDNAGLKKFEAGLANAEKKARVVSAAVLAIGAASIKFFATQQKAEAQLKAALQATGQEVDNNFSSMKEYAQELQKVTTVGDEASLKVMQMALSMGLSADQAKQATKDAIGMSKAFGVDVNTAIKAVSMAIQGDTTMLNRYIPTLRGVKDETKRAAIAQQALADAFKVAEAEAQTAFGQFQQGTNKLGDFMESVGALVLKGLGPLIEKLKTGVDYLASLDDETISNIVNIGLLVAGIYPLIKVIQFMILAYKGALAVKVAFILLMRTESAGLMLLKVQLFALAVAEKAATAAQWAFNVALNANPIGLIVIGIVATIAAIVLLIKYWDQVNAIFEEWGWLLKWIIGPIAILINMIQGVVKWWGLLKESFQAGGIIGALKEIGAGVFNFLILPIRKALELLAMIPGVGSIAQKALDGLNSAQSFVESGTVQGNRKTISSLNDRFGAGIGKATGVVAPSQQSNGAKDVINMNTELTVAVPDKMSVEDGTKWKQDVAGIVATQMNKSIKQARQTGARAE